MNSIKRFFKRIMGSVDNDEIANYYGHGARVAKRHARDDVNDPQTVPQAHYQCPMKCEGDKTYDAPGNCPDCNMKLVQTTEKGSNVHEHEHNGQGHSHHGCC